MASRLLARASLAHVTVPCARALGSASASTSVASTDEIVMRDMEFFARHGALKPERELGQRFVVNVRLAVDLRRVGASDDLAHTVDYAKAWELVREVVERGETRTTIEAVAHETATTLLRAFADARAATVAIDKPHVAIGGRVGSLGVQITRDRGDA